MAKTKAAKLAEPEPKRAKSAPKPKAEPKPKVAPKKQAEPGKTPAEPKAKARQAEKQPDQPEPQVREVDINCLPFTLCWENVGKMMEAFQVSEEEAVRAMEEVLGPRPVANTPPAMPAEIPDSQLKDELTDPAAVADDDEDLDGEECDEECGEECEEECMDEEEGFDEADFAPSAKLVDEVDTQPMTAPAWAGVQISRPNQRWLRPVGLRAHANWF